MRTANVSLNNMTPKYHYTFPAIGFYCASSPPPNAAYTPRQTYTKHTKHETVNMFKACRQVRHRGRSSTVRSNPKGCYIGGKHYCFEHCIATRVVCWCWCVMPRFHKLYNLKSYINWLVVTSFWGCLVGCEVSGWDMECIQFTPQVLTKCL